MRTDEEKVESYHQKYINWRAEKLVEAGSDPHSAQIIAERTDIDLHDAVTMLENGCKPPIMVAILL